MQGALGFIFDLGIVFSIFGFVWGILQFIFKRLLGATSKSSEVTTYVLRITKYFFLVSVVANSIWFKYTKEGALIMKENNMFFLVLGVIVMALYLLGKLQKRSMMAQLGNNPMLGNLFTKIDPKVEHYLLVGSLLYFVACLWQPDMITNGVILWFRDVIRSIQEAFLIGWIFYVAAFVFLVTTIIRFVSLVQNILAGKSPFDGPSMKGMNFGAFGTQFGQRKNDEEDLNTVDTDDEGFTDYEDVTDQEDK
ncbi:MAG: hypothetical protein ABJG68_06800 [Crocinitomicaceae bacterium]